MKKQQPKQVAEPVESYNHATIEPKWQKKWEKAKVGKAKENTKKKKFFGLIEFPYPSGDGLHVGHIRSNTAMDIIARKRRREGFEVLYPIGWDAFGLPTENYAIKTGIQPSIVTKKNTDTFRRQLKSLGFSFDWSREIDTTDPKYYKWTQWIFLQFLKKGLAYKKKMTINWCPKDLIGLANEEVIDGCCERCGTKVEKKEKEQWMLAITKYADRLDKDLDSTEFLEKIKIQQRNWIGKSEGAQIKFEVKNKRTNLQREVEVFTTRPDTLFGVTYIVLAPEHKLVSENIKSCENYAEIEKYIQKAKNETEVERTDATKEKTGVQLKGFVAINPANDEEIPVWISDYVLADYGTGAVMAVPAHDERDWDFAKKYNLPVKEVVIPNRVDKRNPPLPGKKSVERRNVHVIVRNKSGDFLCLKWLKHPWITFPMGGIEEGEDIIEAAKREVIEETGYTDLKNAKILGGQVRAEYFAAHKDVNRVSYTNLVTFDLGSDAKVEISKEESEEHEVFWAKPEQMNYDFLVHAELDVWIDRVKNGIKAYTEDGVLINSGSFNGKDSVSVKKDITKSVNGEWITKFKLRDWIFSRQRYWGEPIPVVHCETCGIVPLPEDELPLKLPKVKNYAPTQTGESPLAAITKWVNTKCPNCKGKAKRETDTMPNWAGSSWYYLRYTDPKNSKYFADSKNINYWTPVDWYNGGMEHTTLHLLYSRFWHKFLFDLGLVPTSEPYKKRTSHGLILAEGGEKMSKSKGNVINPDSIVNALGADTLRIHEMFMGPFDQPIAWDSNAMVGSRRFVERVWKLQYKVKDTDNKDLSPSVHRTIKKVSDDIEAMRFNTAISSMMILVNELESSPEINKSEYEALLNLLAPFAPHIAEELWSIMGHKKSIHSEPWPVFDTTKMVNEDTTIVVQINGKVRTSISAKKDEDKTKLEDKVLASEEVKKWTDGKEILKVIHVPNRLINIVIR